MSRLFKNSEYIISQHAFIRNEVTGNYHKGVDLCCKGRNEDYVLVHTDGVVVELKTTYNKTDTTGGSYGNYVGIKHDKGYETFYAHLKYGSINVKLGDKVKKGDVIGVTGMTGRATGIHLHFEVLKDNVNINPEPYINSDLFPSASIPTNNGDLKVGDKVLVLKGYLTADSYGSGLHTGTYDGNPNDDSNYKIITDIVNDTSRPRPIHVRRTNEQGGTPMGWGSYDQFKKVE